MAQKVVRSTVQGDRCKDRCIDLRRTASKSLEGPSTGRDSLFCGGSERVLIGHLVVFIATSRYLQVDRLHKSPLQLSHSRYPVPPIYCTVPSRKVYIFSFKLSLPFLYFSYLGSSPDTQHVGQCRDIAFIPRFIRTTEPTIITFLKRSWISRIGTGCITVGSAEYCMCDTWRDGSHTVMALHAEWYPLKFTIPAVGEYLMRFES
ncbi:hypothetical protein EDB83DRAFT_1576256 [Lactarius deliciosus]|nr:hypothetical protein EDB83DRAFT_1576256 [Lactarius deliciosus]